MKKIVRGDNYVRESVSEKLIVMCGDEAAELVCQALNADPQRSDSDWFFVRDASYVPYRSEP